MQPHDGPFSTLGCMLCLLWLLSHTLAGIALNVWRFDRPHRHNGSVLLPLLRHRSLMLIDGLHNGVAMWASIADGLHLRVVYVAA